MSKKKSVFKRGMLSGLRSIGAYEKGFGPKKEKKEKK